jgi:hypothetical protein
MHREKAVPHLGFNLGLIERIRKSCDHVRTREFFSASNKTGPHQGKVRALFSRRC